MAYTERSDDPALSVEQAQSRARRWRLVGAVVLVPVVIGAVATVALYATRANPPAPKAPIDTAPDTLVRDGSILIIQPRSPEAVKIQVGQVVEIVLQSGPGQTVTAGNPAILASAPTPPCHIFTLCGIPGVQTWTFRASAAGATDLMITFGSLQYSCGIDATPCTPAPPKHSVLVKPVTVGAAPQPG